jgi:hypothetical protein
MSSLLTIVIPTRDRVELLRLTLASVYERQTRIPPVIVSDNSTKTDDGEMENLRRRYGFSYVRQSGQLPLTKHHNACLAMPSTPWVWMLHDDDELMPGVVAEVESTLAECPDVGLLVGGVEYISSDGHPSRAWVPVAGKTRGEEAMRAIGLDWQARAPSQVFSVEAARKLGGYADTAGVTGDYAFAVLMAKEFGVTFYPRLIGRFREGHSHAADFTSGSERIDRWFEFNYQQARVIGSSGCSPQVHAELTDYLMWNTLWQLLTRQGTSVPHLARRTRFCRAHSPNPGKWRGRVQKEFPILLQRPTWLWLSLFCALVRVNAAFRRLSGGKSLIFAKAIRPMFWTGPADG